MQTTHPDSVSVVLPVFNQADHLEGMVQRYRSALGSAQVPHEILLVENGSIDDSRALVRDLEARFPEVRGIYLSQAGWGGAVLEGLQRAQGNWLCFTNSARTAPESLPAWVEIARRHPLAVTKITRVQRSGLRRLGSLLYNLENRILHNVRSDDVNGTPKIFARAVWNRVRLSERGNLLDLQLLKEAARLGIPVHEISAPFPARLGGVSTTGWRAALGMYAGSLGLWRRRAI